MAPTELADAGEEAASGWTEAQEGWLIARRGTPVAEKVWLKAGGGLAVALVYTTSSHY